MKVVARAVVALGCFGVVGLASGCGAPVETGTGTGTKGQGDQGLLILNPIFLPPPPLPLIDDTQPAVANGATCGSTTIAPPTSLAGFNCSYGVEVLTDENMLITEGSPVPGFIAPDGTALVAYVWACEVVSSSGESLDDALLAVEDVDAGEPTAFGGPAVAVDPPFAEIAVNTTTYTDTCYGAANPGYALVALTYRRHSHKPSCPDGDCNSGNGSGSGGTGSGGTGSGDPGTGTPIVGGPIIITGPIFTI